MNFRGQDTENKFQFDAVNEPIADEYIENLQQQLHFMDLEFKILREKVSEDEKKASIGSLYDDDKTSHQHITLLKTKYAKMLRDYHIVMTRLQKKDVEIKGEGFVLKTQQETAKRQNEVLKAEYEAFKREAQANIREMKKRHDLINRERSDIENEVTVVLKNELQHTRDTRFDHKMTIDKEAENERILKYRHDQECKLLAELIKKKEEEQKELIAGQA